MVRISCLCACDVLQWGGSVGAGVGHAPCRHPLPPWRSCHSSSPLRFLSFPCRCHLIIIHPLIMTCILPPLHPFHRAPTPFSIPAYTAPSTCSLNLTSSPQILRRTPSTTVRTAAHRLWSTLPSSPSTATPRTVMMPIRTLLSMPAPLV